MPHPTVPLADGDLLQHRHHIIPHHLPGLEPSLQRVQGSLIATHIREVAVDVSRDREEKALAWQADVEKGVPDLLGSKLTYILCLI